MKLRLRTQSLIALIFMLVSGTVHGQASLHYWPTKEILSNGQVRFRIIEEDTSLRNRQNQISQQVIYDATLNANEVPTDVVAFVSQILKQNQEERRVHPRLPGVGLPLWVPVKDAWTAADEDAYSTWFASVDAAFNSGTGLMADCADVGLLFRWVYARNNLLPIANTMSGSGKLFGHFSSNSDWDKLPTNTDWKKDERFKAALRYLFNNTYTQTVLGDLYPTLVTPAYVRPGSMVMIIRPTSGHTQTVHQVDPTQGISTLWGNEPAAETIYLSPLLIEVQNKMTIGMWRPVQKIASAGVGTWQLTAAKDMPGYSLAQFQQVFSTNAEYGDWLDQQLGVQESDITRFSILIGAFIQSLQMRMDVTAESIPFCVLTPCALNSADYNNYSSFARDARITSEQQELSTLLQTLGPQNPSVLVIEQSFQLQNEVIQGSGLTYLALLQDPSLIAKFNSDPRVSFEARWGIAPRTPNPTLDFYTLAQALYSLLSERQNTVVNGYYACAEKCDPNSASVKALNTARLDSGMKLIYQNLIRTAAATGVSASAEPAVRAYYGKASVYYLNNPICANNGACTFDDLIWGMGAATHVSKWSPNAQDSISARWGY